MENTSCRSAPATQTVWKAYSNEIQYPEALYLWSQIDSDCKPQRYTDPIQTLWKHFHVKSLLFSFIYLIFSLGFYVCTFIINPLSSRYRALKINALFTDLAARPIQLFFVPLHDISSQQSPPPFLSPPFFWQEKNLKKKKKKFAKQTSVQQKNHYQTQSLWSKQGINPWCLPQEMF